MALCLGNVVDEGNCVALYQRYAAVDDMGVERFMDTVKQHHHDAFWLS